MKTKKELKYGGLLMLALVAILAVSLVLSTGVMAYFIDGDGEILPPQGEVENGEEIREVEVELNDHEFAPNEIIVDAGEEVNFIVENSGSNFHTFTVYNPDEDQEYALAGAGVKPGDEEVVTAEIPEENQELLLVCYFHEEEGMVGTITVQ